MKKSAIAGIVGIIVVIVLLAYPYPVEEETEKEIQEEILQKEELTPEEQPPEEETVPEPTIEEERMEDLMEKPPITTEKETTLSCSGNADCIMGTVTNVIDGDTIEVDGIRIRLALTSTPELSEEYGIEAKQFTSEFCPIGSDALVDEDDMQTGGSYGRTIGKVYCEGEILNSALLENGLADIDERFCSTSEFSSEGWAKKYGCTQTVQTNEDKQTSSQPPASVPTKTKENSCDPSYPDVCIPPSPPDLDCGEIQYHNFKVLPPDPHRFDGDKDGIGCEE